MGPVDGGAASEAFPQPAHPSRVPLHPPSPHSFPEPPNSRSKEEEIAATSSSKIAYIFEREITSILCIIEAVLVISVVSSTRSLFTATGWNLVKGSCCRKEFTELN